MFRTSSLTDDPSILLDDISESLNNQKRPTRGDLSPIQLLSLSKEEIKRVNDLSVDRNENIPEVKGLKKLEVGDTVRILMMTRKQQVQNTVKGFTAKWSRDIHTVLKKMAIPRNPLNFRYWTDRANQSYFRHELLKVPRRVDKAVLDLLDRKQKVVAPEENWSDLEYDSDDSRG